MSVTGIERSGLGIVVFVAAVHFRYLREVWGRDIWDVDGKDYSLVLKRILLPLKSPPSLQNRGKSLLVESI